MIFAQLGGAIFTAFMASVAVYKIWYIVTGLVVLLLPFFAKWRDVAPLLKDGVWFFIYCLAVALSAAGSIEPENTSYMVSAAAIYPFVFLIFYFIGLRSDFTSISSFMRLQVWTAIVVLAATWDITVADRVGYRMMYVLPYMTPAVVEAMYRGKKLAFLELPIVVLLLVITESRTQIAVALILIVMSAIVFCRSFLQFIGQSIALVCTSVAAVYIGLQVEETRALILKAVVRATLKPIYENGILYDIEIQDDARERIDDLFAVMSGDAGWTGIGYGAFPPIYSDYWKDGLEMSLHSIYQVYWLEMGIFGTTAAAIMFTVFFYKMWVARADRAAQVCAISMTGVLLAGMFHQMHETPTMYAFLATGLGAARKLKQRCNSIS